MTDVEQLGDQLSEPPPLPEPIASFELVPNPSPNGGSFREAKVVELKKKARR